MTREYPCSRQGKALQGLVGVAALPGGSCFSREEDSRGEGESELVACDELKHKQGGKQWTRELSDYLFYQCTWAFDWFSAYSISSLV